MSANGTKTGVHKHSPVLENTAKEEPEVKVTIGGQGHEAALTFAEEAERTDEGAEAELRV